MCCNISSQSNSSYNTNHSKRHIASFSSGPMMRKLLLELNGKLSALIFGFMTKNTSTFHSSCAIKWPTIQMNISRIFFFLCLASAALIRRLVGPSGLVLKAFLPQEWVNMFFNRRFDEENRLFTIWSLPLCLQTAKDVVQGFTSTQFFSLFSIFTHCKMWRFCFGENLRCFDLQTWQRETGLTFTVSY